MIFYGLLFPTISNRILKNTNYWKLVLSLFFVTHFLPEGDIGPIQICYQILGKWYCFHWWITLPGTIYPTSQNWTLKSGKIQFLAILRRPYWIGKLWETHHLPFSRWDTCGHYESHFSRSLKQRSWCYDFSKIALWLAKIRKITTFTLIFQI